MLLITYIIISISIVIFLIYLIINNECIYKLLCIKSKIIDTIKDDYSIKSCNYSSSVYNSDNEFYDTDYALNKINDDVIYDLPYQDNIYDLPYQDNDYDNDNFETVNLK
nr:hypothetical protein [Wadden Sea poxvirus]